MPRTLLNAVRPSSAGAVSGAPYTAVDSTNGNMFAISGRTVAKVANTSGGSLTITLNMPGKSDGQSLTNKTITVPNAEERWLGGLLLSAYQQADGMIYVDWSTATNVSCRVIEP